MTVYTALSGACRVRPGAAGDAVAAVVPAWVAEPATVEEVAGVLRAAAGHRLSVVPRGTGSRLAWGGRPAGCDLVVELGRLDRIIDHAAGDMVVQVQAGVGLDRLGAVVAGAGQRLAWDLPRCAGAGTGTIGGAVAVGSGGPRRLRYGGLRDLLLGVRMVRADGVVAAAGGRVVKNVAGYDLGKLLTGSHGTLGLIVEATLRLHPLPPATGWVTVTAPDPATGYARAQAILDSQLAASAVEVDRPPGRPVAVAALFEGTAAGVAGRAAAAADLVGGAAGDRAPGWFGRWPGEPAGTLVELSFPPARLAEVLDRLAGAAAAAGFPAPVRGSAGVAVLHAGLPASAGPVPVAGFLAALRARVGPPDGSVVVRHAPPAVGAAVDLWGPVDPGALALMRRVKDQFDPDHRLAPGRFVPGSG
jgi:glycolate oxidase FAD binding subunit